VIGRTPLCFGFLTGQYSSREKFAVDDHRNRWKPEQRDKWAGAYPLFLSALSDPNGQTPAQFALRFCLSFPAISSVIPGMLTAAHVDDNTRASELGNLRESERAAVVAVFQEGGRVLGRSMGEAPAWVSRQLQKAVEQYVTSGGNPDAVANDLPRAQAGAHEEGAAADREAGDEFADAPGLDPEARWLDRAAAVIEHRLSRLGGGYVEALLTRFDQHLAQQLAKDPRPTSAAPTAASGPGPGSTLPR